MPTYLLKILTSSYRFKVKTNKQITEASLEKTRRTSTTFCYLYENLILTITVNILKLV